MRVKWWLFWTAFHSVSWWWHMLLIQSEVIRCWSVIYSKPVLILSLLNRSGSGVTCLLPAKCKTFTWRELRLHEEYLQLIYVLNICNNFNSNHFLLSPHSHICNRICHYCTPLSETSLEMAIQWPKHVGGTLQSDQWLYFNGANVGLNIVFCYCVHRGPQLHIILL
jgi:hypothetical protein